MLKTTKKSLKKSKRKWKKYLETNENVNTSIQNLWETAEAVLRGKLIVIQEKLQINQSNIIAEGMRKRANKTSS